MVISVVTICAPLVFLKGLSQVTIQRCSAGRLTVLLSRHQRMRMCIMPTELTPRYALAACSSRQPGMQVE